MSYLGHSVPGHIELLLNHS